MDPYDNAEERWGVRTANPYAAPAAKVADEQAAEAVKASRATRLGAVLLDSAAVAVLAIAAAVLLPATRSGDSAPIVLGGIVLILAAFGVYQIVLLHQNGQTFGKKLLGIKIVRTDGSRAGLARLLVLRYLLPGAISAIPVLGTVFAFVDPLFIFGEDRRCLHDSLADTIVVEA